MGAVVTLNPIGLVVGAALGAGASVGADTVKELHERHLKHDLASDPGSLQAIKRLLRDNEVVARVALGGGAGREGPWTARRSETSVAGARHAT